MKRASCVLISNGEGKYLSVSRKTSSEDKGFPGGSVEIWENDEIAACRETLEETGLIVDRSSLVPIYDGPDTNGFSVITFMASRWNGEVNTTEDGEVAWIWPWEFLKSETCSYYKYNWEVFRRLGIVP